MRIPTYENKARVPIRERIIKWNGPVVIRGRTRVLKLSGTDWMFYSRREPTDQEAAKERDQCQE